MDKHVLTRRSLLATGVALSAGLVAGCATNGKGDANGLVTDDMDRDISIAGASDADEVMNKIVPVEYCEAGTYTVSFTEADLLKDEVVSEAQREVTAVSAPEIAPEIAPASGEEMARDISEIDVLSAEDEDAIAIEASDEGSTSDEDVLSAEDEDAIAIEASDEDVLAEDTDGTAFVVRPIEEDEVVEGASTGSFAAVTRDDVRVVYSVPVIGEDELVEYEERIAPIASFSNDGKTIAVSFANADAEELFTPFYTIAVESLSACVVVGVGFKQDEVQIDVDYDAQLEQIEYQPDIPEEALMLPEGVEFVDGELVVTTDATEDTAVALYDDPALANDMSRDGWDWNVIKQLVDKAIEDYLPASQEEEKKKTEDYWAKFDPVAQYVPAVLGYVDKDVARVAQYGSAIYTLVKGVATVNISDLFSSTTDLLKLVGVIQTSSGVTNEDILAEVKALRADVKELRELVKVMYDKLDEVTKQSYRNGLQSFDNAVIALNTNATIAEKLLSSASQIAMDEGLETPGEGVSQDEYRAYANRIVDIILEQERSNNPNYRQASDVFAAVRNGFIAVAGEAAKDSDLNPLTTYKNYWNTYFNYESQSYWLRKAYAANVEFQVKRAFALLALFHNIGSPASNYDSLADDLKYALEGIAKIELGYDPRTQFHGGNTVNIYSGTFDRKIRTNYFDTGAGGDSAGHMPGSAPVEVIKKLATKCHGRNLKDDLRLAGLWDGGTWSLYEWDGNKMNWDNRGHGLGFNMQGRGDDVTHDILDWDGNLHTAFRSHGRKNFDGVEDFNYWRTPFVAFVFA